MNKIKEAIAILKVGKKSDSLPHKYFCTRLLALLESEPEPEPGEFTETNRARIIRDSATLDDERNHNESAFRCIGQEALEHLGQACDRIDRLTAENKALKEKSL